MDIDKIIYDCIESSENIYIDTSTLMNVENLNNFVIKYKHLFIENEKRIILTREVCLELVKHLSGDNSHKRFLSKQVIKVLKDNITLFKFEDENLSINEAKNTFADGALLARLTEERIYGNQILITNDKNLSIDVNNLSNSLSCKGNIITVYKIDSEGLLCRVNKEVTLESVSIVSKVKNEEVKKVKRSSVITVCSYLLTFGAGALVMKYCEPLSCKLLKEIKI